MNNCCRSIMNKLGMSWWLENIVYCNTTVNRTSNGVHTPSPSQSNTQIANHIIQDNSPNENEDVNIDELTNEHDVMTLEGENNSKVFLVGTNHLSSESTTVVTSVMRAVKPQVVVTELCRSRVGMNETRIFTGAHEFNWTYLKEIIRDIGFFPGLVFFSLAYTERFLANRAGGNYGEEMSAPFTNARDDRPKRKLMLILGDRPIEITLQRQASVLSLYTKIAMMICVGCTVFLGIPGMVLHVPPMLLQDQNFLKVLINERDMYLTFSLQTAASIRLEEPTKVVGVVGRAHVAGITRLWSTVTPEDISDITTPNVR